MEHSETPKFPPVATVKFPRMVRVAFPLNKKLETKVVVPIVSEVFEIMHPLPGMQLLVMFVPTFVLLLVMFVLLLMPVSLFIVKHGESPIRQS